VCLPRYRLRVFLASPSILENFARIILRALCRRCSDCCRIVYTLRYIFSDSLYVSPLDVLRSLAELPPSIGDPTARWRFVTICLEDGRPEVRFAVVRWMRPEVSAPPSLPDPPPPQIPPPTSTITSFFFPILLFVLLQRCPPVFALL